MMFLLILAVPWRCEALPDSHIRFGLRHERVADILLAPVRPFGIALVAQRPDWHVALSTHEFERGWRRHGCNSVNVELEFLAEGLEGQIVNVVAEGVLDFATNGSQSDDNVSSEDASGDGDPVEAVNQLEWQHHDVNPGDLRDGDGVGNGERGLENAVHADHGLVELDDTSDWNPN